PGPPARRPPGDVEYLATVPQRRRRHVQHPVADVLYLVHDCPPRTFTAALLGHSRPSPTFTSGLSGRSRRALSDVRVGPCRTLASGLVGRSRRALSDVHGWPPRMGGCRSTSAPPSTARRLARPREVWLLTVVNETKKPQKS